MGVDQPPAERLEDGGSDDLHETGRDDQIGIESGEFGGQCGVPGAAVGMLGDARTRRWADRDGGPAPAPRRPGRCRRRRRSPGSRGRRPRPAGPRTASPSRTAGRRSAPARWAALRTPPPPDPSRDAGGLQPSDRQRATAAAIAAAMPLCAATAMPVARPAHRPGPRPRHRATRRPPRPGPR